MLKKKPENKVNNPQIRKRYENICIDLEYGSVSLWSVAPIGLARRSVSPLFFRMWLLIGAVVIVFEVRRLPNHGPNHKGEPRRLEMARGWRLDLVQ